MNFRYIRYILIIALAAAMAPSMAIAEEDISPSSATGSLTVTFGPQEARDDGIEWTIDHTNYFESGQTQTLIAPGTYSVHFAGTGWGASGSTQVTITASNTTVADFTLVEVTGFAQVDISPAAANDYGAMWSPDNGQNWYESGQSVELQEGTYDVIFKEIDYFLEPAPLSILVQQGAADVWNASYTRETGSLEIFIEPEDVANSGGAFRMVGETIWRFSGYTYGGLDAGEYEVEFQQLGFYQSPPVTTYKVFGSQTNTYTATYYEKEGTLTVVLTDNDPGSDVNSQGAQWSLASDGLWRNSGDSVTVRAPSSQVLNFRDVNGFEAPGQTSVQIRPGDDLTRTFEYDRIDPQYTGMAIDEFGNALPGTTLQISTKDGTVVKTVTVNNDGTFEVRGLTPYIIHYFKPFKQNYVFVPDPYLNRTLEENSDDPITFKGTYEPQDLFITGVVTTAGGLPIEGAVVQLYGSSSIRAYTNELGMYRFDGLGNGTYTVESYGATGYLPGEVDSQEITLDNESATDIDFDVIRADLNLGGVVYNYNKTERLSNIEVELRGKGIKRTVRTNDDGIYLFFELPAGRYTLEVLDTTRLYKSRTAKIELLDGSKDQVDFMEKLPLAGAVKVAGITVSADKIEKISDTLYKTSGLAYLGKHLLVQTDAPLTLDLAAGTISGNGQVTAPTIINVGTLTFFNGEFSINSDNFPLVRTYRVNWTGVDFTLDAAENKDDYLLLQGKFKLDILVFSLTATGEFECTAEQTRLKNLTAKSTNKLEIKKDWGLSDIEVRYDSEKKIFGGGAALKTPLIEIGAYLEFYQGILNAIGFKVGGELPIYAPVLYFSNASGRLKNMADPDEPLELLMGMGIGAGPKLGLWRLVEASGSLSMNASASFVAKVVAKLLGIEIGRVTITYDHLPGPFLKFVSKLKFGEIVYVEGDVDANMTFQPFSAWGKADVGIVYRANIVGENIEQTLAGVGTELTHSELRMWAELFGGVLEAVVDGDGFRVTKPDWLTGIKIQFSEDGRVIAQTASLKSSRNGRFVVPPNSKDSHSIPGGLDSINLMIAWRGEEGIEPVIIDPDGTRYQGGEAGSGMTFARIHGRAVSYTFQNPDEGTWRVRFPNTADIDSFSSYATHYEPLPGVAIEGVQQLGPREYDISLSRSGFEDEAVQLFYGPVDGDDQLMVIAADEELGDATSWTWDASTVPAGNYYLYARVSDDRRPFTYRYDDPVNLPGDPALRVQGRPSLKAVKDGMKVFWEKLDGVNVDYYRVYYTDSLDTEGYDQWVDFQGYRQSGTLDFEKLPPGRRYRLVVAARLEDGTEGEYSRPKQFRYKSKRTNNVPFFPFTPDDRVRLGDTYTFDPRARDFDKDSLRYTLLEGPEGVSLNPDTGEITWTPASDQAGYNIFQLLVDDGNGGQEELFWNVFASDQQQTGILDARAITRSNGEKAYVLAYWNPHLNQHDRTPEMLPATIRSAASGQPGTSLVFKESGNDSGYFAAVVSESELRSLQEAAITAGVANFRLLQDVVIEMKGRHRTEKTVIRLKN